MDRTHRHWRPTAQLANLRLRAELLRRTRHYFDERHVMEVETPVLSSAAVTDLHLHSIRTQVQGLGEFFLQTSPEFAMKRLLAAGSGDIYQIARVFRDGERGALHHPEFTLIEWYRLGFTMQQLMADAAALLDRLLTELHLGPPRYQTYREAFLEYAGLDPLEAPLAVLQDCAIAHGLALPTPEPEDRDECLDLLMSMLIGPKLGAGCLTFVLEYPASQAALARLKPDDPRVAERFEIYLQGIELANGFRELVDADEQRARFRQDLLRRRTRGLPQPPMDECLLAALESGLPQCAGVAVGFDRVVMLAAGAEVIDEVLSFAIAAPNPHYS